MIGDYVEVDGEDAEIWKLYMTLRDICQFYSKLTVSEVDVPFIRNLVQEHHRLFLALSSPGTTFKPKHHYMLHHDDCLMKIGPLKNVSCYPFEHNHKPYKQYANVTCNHRNLPLSLAVKGQLKLCYSFLSRQGFVSRFNISPGEDIPVESIENVAECGHALPEDLSSVHSVHWAEKFGTRYHVGMLVVAKFDENYPVFACIRLISIVDPEEIYFL